jgi:hypothetical protein
VETLKWVMAHPDGMRPAEQLLDNRPLSGVDVAMPRVARGLAFVLAVGALAGGGLALLERSADVPRRFRLLALLALPLLPFTFGTLELGADVRLSGALAPTPGVVESWWLVVLGAATVTLVYGPMVGVPEATVVVALILLAGFTYLLGPPWLAWRVLEGETAADVAAVTLALSVPSLLAGLAVGALPVAERVSGASVLAGLGAAGVLVVCILAGR